MADYEKLGRGLRYLRGTNDKLIVLLSGDGGGFGGVTKAVAEGLHAEGYSVLWFNCFPRWWQPGKWKSGGAADPTTLLDDVFWWVHWAGFGAASDKEVTVIGYSFGSDVAPFLGNFLLAEKVLVTSVMLLEPGEKAAFRPSIAGWRNIEYGTWPVVPELLLSQVPTTVFYADDKVKGYMGGRKHSPGRDEALQAGANPLVQTKYLWGNHTFDKKYGELMRYVNVALHDWGALSTFHL